MPRLAPTSPSVSGARRKTAGIMPAGIGGLSRELSMTLCSNLLTWSGRTTRTFARVLAMSFGLGLASAAADCEKCPLLGVWHLYWPDGGKRDVTPEEFCKTHAAAAPYLDLYLVDERLAMSMVDEHGVGRRVIFDEEVKYIGRGAFDMYFQTTDDGWPSHEITIEIADLPEGPVVLLRAAGDVAVNGAYLRCDVP